jgi:hypothetical protein
MREEKLITDKRNYLNRQKQQKNIELLDKLRQIELSVKSNIKKPKPETKVVKYKCPEINELQQKLIEKRQGKN